MRVLTVIGLVFIVVLQYRVWFGEGSLPDAWGMREQVDSARIQTQQMVERNRALYAEVNDLKDGLEAVDEIARTDLGMIRKGEVFFQVVGDPVETAPVPAETDPNLDATE